MGNAVITLRDLMPVAHPEKTKIKFNMNAGDVNVRAYDMLLKDTSTPEKTDSGAMVRDERVEERDGTSE